jgi:NADPH2:quinone reductase
VLLRAIRFEAFGDPSVLKLVELAAPAAAKRTALVRVMAASINPSDVKNVAGAMKQTTLPRIPSRDFAGVVEAGPAEWIGAEVWGTGGDTGFTRDGTHAELITVPVASLRRKPDVLSFDEAASIGVNYMAAWCGLEAAGLEAGKTVLLIGAGAVLAAPPPGLLDAAAPACSVPKGTCRTRTRRSMALRRS